MKTIKVTNIEYCGDADLVEDFPTELTIKMSNEEYEDEDDLYGALLDKISEIATDGEFDVDSFDMN